MCVCRVPGGFTGHQGASWGTRGLRRLSAQVAAGAVRAPGSLQTRCPSTLCRVHLASPVRTHSCHSVRAEARPDPRFSAPGWNQGLQEAWPSVSRVHGDQRAGHHPQPVLGGRPNPGLRWDTHSQGTRPIPGQKVGPEQGPPGRHHLGAPPVLECARLSRAATAWGGAEAGGMEAQGAYGARAPRTPFLGMSAGPQPQHHL